MGKSSKEQLAKDDRKILAELQKNSNESINTIAKHCGFSRQRHILVLSQRLAFCRHFLSRGNIKSSTLILRN
jgi:AraC-like DNA-binding protein